MRVVVRVDVLGVKVDVRAHDNVGVSGGGRCIRTRHGYRRAGQDGSGGAECKDY